MRYRSGEFTPNDEVDDIDWLRVGRAYQRLTYDVDRNVLRDFAALPVADSVDRAGASRQGRQAQ